MRGPAATYPASGGPSIFLDKSGRGRDLFRKIEVACVAGAKRGGRKARKRGKGRERGFL